MTEVRHRQRPDQEGAAPEPLRMGQREAEPRQSQERTRNRPREPVPDRLARDLDGRELQEAEVPEEMIGDHRGDRDAAGDVDGIPSALDDGSGGGGDHAEV